jgi:uncharacterized protein (TIGR02145 family)/uncharacterized repeat protein (TIGR02543 family)
MLKNPSWLFFAASILVPLLLSCSDTKSPFTAASATISVVLENSNGLRSAETVSDTVDKAVHIGVSAYLPKYINSVTVAITKSTGDTDTVHTFGQSFASADTQWIEISFHSAGTRTVSAVAAVQGAPNYSLTAQIVIAEKPSAVTYNGNGNTGGTRPTDANTYLQGATVTVKANIGALVRTGYTFAGWNTAADGKGTSYAAGETFNMGASNVILYAKWTQNQTYSVTYDGNDNIGGTVPTDANAYEQGANVTIKTNTGNLTKTSYTFAGWNTAADGKGTSYTGGETFNIGAANVTLYAKWTQNPTYNVTYNGNGNTDGTTPVDANAYEQGSSVTVKANTGNLVKTSYTFAGWNTAADGKGTSYAGSETFNISTANIILYAKWTQNPTYTVTYSGNGSTSGDVPTDANAYEQNAIVTVKANTGNLAKTGYTFAGWNTAADGNGQSYAPGETFEMGISNVSLYAKWTINIYTVKFNSNGGSSVDSQNITYNTTATSPTPATRNGYVFSGWYSDQALTIQFNFMTLITSAVTLYAKWTPVYTVTYLPNSNTSGTVPIDANNYTNGTTVTVLDNTGSLIRTGYTFAGWNTNPTGTGTDRIPGSTFAMGSGNVALYAKWTINKYIVTFNSNGGSAVASQSVDYGTLATAPTAPTKTSYVFAGWYSDQALTSAFLFSTPIFANKTLYAKWEIRDADGNVYTEVTIGTQVWMVENLKTTKYNDGTGIPLVPDSSTWVYATSMSYPAFCWFLNDSTTYKNPYGALYNWYSINTGKLAPFGWHVATDGEWNVMISSLGGATTAGGKMKESGLAHWQSPNTGATNSSGFTGLPGSFRYDQGTFVIPFGVTGMWWTSTEDAYNPHAIFYSLGSDAANVGTYHIGKGEGHSVRCIRDY